MRRVRPISSCLRELYLRTVPRGRGAGLGSILAVLVVGAAALPSDSFAARAGWDDVMDSRVEETLPGASSSPQRVGYHACSFRCSTSTPGLRSALQIDLAYSGQSARAGTMSLINVERRMLESTVEMPGVKAAGRTAGAAMPRVSSFTGSLGQAFVDDEYVAQPPRFFIALGEVVAVNALVWSYNRFIAGANWAKISGESMKANLREGWRWDDNAFSNNQIAHPYHGSLYYNAARSNGYNYWQSVPFVFFGSWMWEFLGETHHPAPNDWLMTSIGGIGLGEMLFRVSNSVINHNATGAKRGWSEFGGAVLNPVQALNRAVRGDMTRVGNEPTHLFPSQVKSEFLLGGMQTGDDEGLKNGTTQVYARFEIDWGDKWEDDIDAPFDVFELRLQLNSRDVASISTVQVDAQLLGSDVQYTDQKIHKVGAVQRFEYINNRFFEFGAQSFGVTFHSKWNLSGKTHVRTSVNARGIVIGATSSEYADIGGRTYDYGPGAGLGLQARLNVKNHDWLRVNYAWNWIHTANGGDGDHHVSGGNVRLVVPVWRQFGLGLDYGFYSRTSYFDDFPDSNRRNAQLRWYLAWKLN